jgi:hypothetical protein
VVNGNHILTTLFFLFINLQDGFTQTDQNSIGFTPLQGITIFTPDNNHLKGNFYGAEIAYQLNMSNNKASWISLLHVQDVSFIGVWFNTQSILLKEAPGSKGLLGNTFGILNMLGISLFKARNATLLFAPGIGFVYTTQTYYNNPNDYLVGSHINLAVQAGFKIEMPVSASTKLTAGVDFFHYSNSAFRLPNMGINNINASLGMVRDINTPGQERKKETFGIDDKYSVEFGIGFGRRGFIQAGRYINPQTGKAIPLPDSAAQKNAASNLFMAGIYGGYSYRLNSLLSLKLETDAVYYFKPFSWDNFYRTYQESGTSLDNLALGVSTGVDLWMGRMALMANYGYYLHYSSINPYHFYWIMGGKYYLNNWLALNAKIYIHTFEAHYANFGLVFNVH